MCLKLVPDVLKVIWTLFPFGEYYGSPSASCMAGTEEVSNKRCWVDWTKEWSLLCTRHWPVNTCASKEQKDCFPKCVLGGPGHSNLLGKLLQCKFLSSIQISCIRISAGGLQEYALLIPSLHRSDALFNLRPML